MNTFSPQRQAGFSMIEVLVSLLITVIGVLGMVALQSKAIPYTQDSVQRNTAMMLADDLVEMIRTAGSCTASNNCLKPPGTPFADATTSCVPTPTVLAQQIGCWKAQAGKALPGATDLLTGLFYICRSVKPGDVGTSACGTENTLDTEIEIQVAWSVKNNADCMDANAKNSICTYRIRTRLP
ncbi:MULTISPECIES: type IV pilus modification protein PilV [unclassified Pseudomonas]|uniref:type IV pilus modification protein PilV n=1 Tax=unclassified Pseudomonas TaxID=196821 RepID=UPI0025FD8DEA|nr:MULTISPECIES: type IV pilus modification protein PilV [unclassified Pseudomonas]